MPAHCKGYNVTLVNKEYLARKDWNKSGSTQRYIHRTFFEMVYDVSRRIPEGRLTTYSAIAKFLGNPRGARAVGWAMRVCSYDDVPCHRVVRSDGHLSGYPDDVRKRIARLKKEKIVVSGGWVDIGKYFYDDFNFAKN